LQVKYFRRHLMLKGEYAEKVLRGEKRATIRVGKYIPKYREIIIHSGGRPLCIAEIVNVTHKRVRELTDEDAVKDGFRNVKELINALRKIYGDISQDEYVTVIEFKVRKRLDDLKCGDEYLGLNPADIARLSLRYLRDELTPAELRILEELGKGLSIRAVARKLTGDPTKRYQVRRAVRRALRKLVEKGYLKPRESGCE
jgi:hypothetical protein